MAIGIKFYTLFDADTNKVIIEGKDQLVQRAMQEAREYARQAQMQSERENGSELQA